MTVNADKSKVMHFRPQSVTRTGVIFMCGACDLAVTDSYTYLGLVLTEHLDYAVTAKYVAQSAGRALGLVIAKCKVMGGTPYNVYTKLYDSMVWPVISYGAAIWGCNEYSCINAVQHRAARFYLGLGKYTPNAGVNGDIGWKPPNVKQMKCVANQWYKFVNMEACRFNKKVFEWVCRKANNRCKNWSFRIRSKLNSIDIGENSYDVSKWAFCNSVELALMHTYTNQWKESVNKVYDNSRVAGGNKLRHYSQFKTEFEVEHYVMNVICYQHRSALAKFRCGVAPIKIETGRYDRLAIEDRTCYNCLDKIEDEVHVLLQCPVYAHIRHDVLQEAQLCHTDFMLFNAEQQLHFLLSNKDMCRNVAKTCHDILAFRRKLLYTS